MEETKSNFSIIEVDNVQYETLLTRNFLNRKPYEPKNTKLIKAFIPGVIKKIYVKEGEKVKIGDKLLVLEAMKMNNDLIASVAGKIHKINIKTGEHVHKNFVLIEMK